MSTNTNMTDSQVFREWSGHYIKKFSFVIFTLALAYVHVGLYGFYEGFYHVFFFARTFIILKHCWNTKASVELLLSFCYGYDFM